MCVSGNVSIGSGFALQSLGFGRLNHCKAFKRTLPNSRAQQHQENSIIGILESVAHGRADLEDAARSLEELTSGLHALRRPESIVDVFDADGMPAAQIASQLEANALKQHRAAARLVPSETFAAIRKMLPGVQYHAGAHMLLYTDPSGIAAKPERLPGHVAVVCGNGADMRMAFETKIALDLMGAYATMVQGVSAVDLHSLVSRKEQLTAADAIVVCCAEQPALAGLVASLVDCPVVALPGVGRPDPTTAICAQGLSTVAPANGVSAAAAAVRTLKVAAQYIQYRKDREAPPHMLQEPLLRPAKHLDQEAVPTGCSNSAGGMQPMQAPCHSILRVSVKNTQHP